MKMTKPKHYRPPGKKKQGNVAKYITRNKALNRLQIKLPEFRRLCILKGIHPREPKKKFEGNHKTYYHLKDINFLAHEPLLEKSRAIKAFEKKVKRAKAKKNFNLARRLETNRPVYSLDHLVKERYPSFVDALRDLDDPLTMLHLFATFPAEASYKIPSEIITTCRRLSLEWQAYIARTRSLLYTFISVKGIYYQAEVAGQKITWLTPHVLSQVIPDDVDIRVMLTFVEFYETLMGFINFKLYHSLGLKYPPILDPQLEAEAAELYAVVRDLGRESVELRQDDKKRDTTGEHGDLDAGCSEVAEMRLAESQSRLTMLQERLSKSMRENPREMKDQGASNLSDDEQQNEDDGDDDTKKRKTLFRDLKFFLGREVPRESLLLLIRSFGGSASWDGDGAPYKESDEDITHQIVDRPAQGHTFLSREYIQPQWVYDSVNSRILLPTVDYTLGRAPPPHLSPFVDNEKEGYLPEYADTIKRLQAASNQKVLPLPDEDVFEDSNRFLASVVAQRTDANQEAIKEKKEASVEKTYKEELDKEVAGIPYSVSLQTKDMDGEGNDQKLPSGDASLPDEIPAHVMMPRKARKLYEAIQIGKSKKRAEVQLLRERKRKAEEQVIKDK